MSNASDAFGSPVVRKINGAEVSFPRLVGRDYGVLEDAVRAKLAAVDREVADECELSGRERFDRLRECAARPVTLADVEVALHGQEFSDKALEISLKKAGHPKPADVIDTMPAGDKTMLAQILVGFLVPFENTKLVEWHGLAASIRKHFPGTDPAELTLGQLSNLLAVAKSNG
jgi:hypothetical protein